MWQPQYADKIILELLGCSFCHLGWVKLSISSIYAKIGYEGIVRIGYWCTYNLNFKNVGTMCKVEIQSKFNDLQTHILFPIEHKEHISY